MNTLILESILTCPQCGRTTLTTMPTDSCQLFFECPHCHALLRPKAGDCCVFCSYGSVSCPLVQIARAAGESWPGHCC